MEKEEEKKPQKKLKRRAAAEIRGFGTREDVMDAARPPCPE